MDDQDYEDEDTSFEPVGKCKTCGDPVVSAAGGVFGADFDFCGEHAEPGVMRT